MSRLSSNSLLYTLRGKIWISTSVLAFFICTFGLISYLVVTLLTNNPFYGVFIPFLFLAFSVIVFGWWLSNELVSPIDNVILLSKSLERNSSTSLPKTSGSGETDQLLQSLHRNSQQMQNVVTLMDKVANGNIDIALTPLKGSDRLTASFQKLLSKVSESIHAKDELTKLESEIENVKSEITNVRNGNLSVDIKTENVHTKEIAETINYLVENLTLMISLIKVDSHIAQNSADDIEEKLELLIKQDEQRIQKINQASITLKQVPNFIDKITENLTQSAKSAKHTIEKTRQGSVISQENSESVSKLRSNLRESINRIQNLNEKSHEIAKVAKNVEDLANRTNMIALNASIQATEFGDDGHSFVLVSEELERLAARADGTNKQISLLNNTIISEISRVEDSLETTLAGVAGLSKHSIETGNVLGELERYIGQFLNLQDNLIAVSKDQSEETDEAFETVESFISETENKISEMADSATEIKKISLMMKNLQSHSAGFRATPQIESQEDETANQFENNQHPESSQQDLENNEVFTTDEFNKAKLSTQEFQDMTDESEETNPKTSDSEEFYSEDLEQSKISDDEFNSQELNISNMSSGEFNPDELFNKSFSPIENIEDESNLLEADLSNELVESFSSDESFPSDESFSSDEFDSKESLEDDLSIDKETFEESELQAIKDTSPILEDFDNDDLLNLNSKTSQDQNSEIPA